MKNFFLFCCCCMSLSNITAQYNFNTPVSNIILIEENEKSVAYTKLTAENCSTEIGFGLSDCGFEELTTFMSKINYPQLAYELNIEDNCTITFTGTKEGKTENIIASDCLAIFQKPIQAHLSNMTWQPVYKNGKAIDFTITFKTVFKTEL